MEGESLPLGIVTCEEIALYISQRHDKTYFYNNFGWFLRGNKVSRVELERHIFSKVIEEYQRLQRTLKDPLLHKYVSDILHKCATPRFRVRVMRELEEYCYIPVC